VTVPELAMSTQVTTALLSGGVALAVALLGIAGAIAAQLVATRRAFANSLALFERQHAKQEASSKREREEATRREDARRFAEQRRTTYARFLQLAGEIVTAQEAVDAFADARQKSAEREGDAEAKQRAADHAGRKIADNLDRAQKASDQLPGIVAEIDLLGSADLRAAASTLSRATDWSSGAAREFPAAREAFLRAARHELAIGALPS
jgi:hypothetical protein